MMLRRDASYLLVGGLGGIGVEMAKWMVHSQGATSLIFVSRSGLDSAAAAAALDALQKPGVTITVRKCDVADYKKLSAVLDECSKSLPAIRGVIQCAMVLQVCPRRICHCCCRRRMLTPRSRTQHSKT